MSSSSASTSFISSAVLTARAYVPKLDMFLAFLANVGLGADQKTVVGAMKVFEKWLWHKGQAAEAPAPPSIDEQLASLLADDGPFTLWAELSPDSKVAAYVEPLVQMDLARQERQWAEAAAQSAAIMSAEWEVELLEERRVALAKFSAKCTADAQAAGFLEAVEVGTAGGGDAVEMGEMAAEVEAAAAEPVDESEAPEDEDDADNEDEVPVTPKRVPTAGGSGRLPAVIKRASKSTTPSKRHTQKVVPQYELPTATTFTNAQLCNLLVPRRDEVVLDNDRWAGENVPGVKGKKTVSLAACNDCKTRKGLCDKCWADNDPECCWYPTGTQPCHRCDALKRACTISGQKSRERGKVDPHVQRNFEKAVLVQRAQAFILEQWKLSAAGKEETLPMVGLSRQIILVDPIKSILCPGGVVLSEPESLSVAAVQSEPEEAAESSDLSESLSEVPAVLLRAVQLNYAPLPTSSVNGQEFLWLGKVLDYPISALRPTQYIEAAKEKAAGMAEVMQKDMRAAAVEMEGLRLQKRIMVRSIDILERYQADCAEALEWREANKTHLRQPYATLFPLPPGTSLDP
ncbi:hypothetical protein C0992_005034 [Termitomyces sp. T32_za158]|nr:hypothetical protein C0992_005034 [Termitomyces sp. T32_za158]